MTAADSSFSKQKQQQQHAFLLRNRQQRITARDATSILFYLKLPLSFCVVLLICAGCFQLAQTVLQIAGCRSSTFVLPLSSGSQVVPHTMRPVYSADTDGDMVLQSVYKYHEELARIRIRQSSELYPPPDPSPHPILSTIHKNSYSPKSEWADMMYPDITVAGMPKSATSHLHHILKSHPDAQQLFSNCGGLREEEVEYSRMMIPPDKNTFNEASQIEFQRKLYQSFQEIEYLCAAEATLRNATATTTNTTPRRKTTFINALDYHDILLRAQYLQPAPTRPRKFIVILRDPADWWWATWNFWSRSELDAKAPLRADWAEPILHYRSPELFHEILLGGDRLQPFHMLDAFRKASVTLPRILIAAFGQDNVLIAKTEHLLPQNIFKTGGFLERLSNFTGLSFDGFSTAVTNTLHNCNHQKGNFVACNSSRVSSSQAAYEITNHRPMLPQTRRLAYLHFAAECKIWNEEFGVEYSGCLSIAKELENNNNKRSSTTYT